MPQLPAIIRKIPNEQGKTMHGLRQKCQQEILFMPSSRCSLCLAAETKHQHTLETFRLHVGEATPLYYCDFVRYLEATGNYTF